jgi:biotin carboxyl carrier protein
VKYRVHIGPHAIDVELEEGRVVLNGTPVEAHLTAVPGTPLYYLRLGDESWTVAADELDPAGRWALDLLGERVEVTVADERTQETPAPAGARPAASGGATLQAPMPGLIVRVAVSVGERVEAGAGLVVVEAMKMENELRAPQSGVVTAVHVAAGAAVEKGAPLVTLADAEAERGPGEDERRSPGGP